MHALQPKDSIYAIEPWNDEPTVLPTSFLATHQFAKTAFPASALKSAKNLQISNNSVYLIKNMQDIQCQAGKKRLRFHCTAQNSPRMGLQHEERQSLRRGLSDKLTRSHQMMKSYKKKPLDDDLMHPKFQQTKQTFIEFKLIKRSRRASQEDTDLKNAEGKSNLQKKYERSTLSKDLKKKEGMMEEGQEELCIRRKLKTEKSKHLESVKNLLNFTEDPEKEQAALPLKLNSQLSMKESQCSKEDGGGQKLKFELMMERKLFLMKNHLSKWHKNIENYSIGANRKSK